MRTDSQFLIVEVTMEFVIVRDAEVTFSGPPNSSSAGLQRISGTVNVEIQATKNDDDGTDNEDYLEKLTKAVNKNPWNQASRDSEIDWTLKVAISLPDPSSQVSSDAGPKDGKMIVYAKSDYVNGFLHILHYGFNMNVDGSNVTMNVVVKDFGLRGKSTPHQNCPHQFNWEAKGLEINWISFEHVEGCNVGCISKPNALSGITGCYAWKNGHEFCGKFTISVVLNSSALNLLNSLELDYPNERPEYLKEMLKDEICTDLEIIAGVSSDHKVIKCHRAVLATGSKVFRGMFESGMKEATENKIKIEDMSEEGVRAMLAYLYHRDITTAYESSEIALELLQAGEKYDVQDLKECVREYMMAKENRWFGVDMILTLYVFVKALCLEKRDEILDEEETCGNVESGQNDEMEEEEEDDEIEAWRSLKIKCLKVLKWYIKMKPKTLLESAKYQEIFIGNPKLGMEITAGILRLD